MDIQTAKSAFEKEGYECIPLRWLSKQPLSSKWPTKSVFQQWQEVKDEKVNLGLRAGNGKAFIDCDDKNIPGTSENVFNWLASLGYPRGSYPIIQTASGIGHHVYVSFTDYLPGNISNFIPSMGAGDFRYAPGAQVVTFPSVITGSGEYKLIAGNIAHLPKLDLKDISMLIKITNPCHDQSEIKPLNIMPLETNLPYKYKKLQHRSISQLAKKISEGKRLSKYKSDSEAEGALVLSLINTGYRDEEIKEHFMQHPCRGHYKNKHAIKSFEEGDRWISRTIKNMRKYAKNESLPRQKIANWQKRLKAMPWSNSTEKDLFASILEVAYQAGRFVISLSVREGSLRAGAGLEAVANGLKRLIAKGLIERTRSTSGVYAATYKLIEDKVEHSLPPLPSERVCSTYSSPLSSLDAFRNGGGRYAKGRLGKRAGEIYELLLNQGEELTLKEIQSRCGASPKTIKRALKKLSGVVNHKTGEILVMVTHCDNGKWKAVPVDDLNLVAEFVGTAGLTQKKQLQYESERRNHARALKVYKHNSHHSKKT